MNWNAIKPDFSELINMFLELWPLWLLIIIIGIFLEKSFPNHTYKKKTITEARKRAKKKK